MDLGLPAPGFGPPLVAVALGNDVADTGPREMKTDATGVFRGGFGPEFLPSDDRLLRVVIEGDCPSGVGEHQQVMMGEIHEVEQFVAARADAETRVSRSVTGSGFDGDEAIKELAAVLQGNGHRFENIEFFPRALDHIGQRLLLPFGF